MTTKTKNAAAKKDETKTSTPKLAPAKAPKLPLAKKDEEHDEDEAEDGEEGRETRTSRTGREKIVKAYAAIARRTQKLAASLIDSPLAKDAEHLAHKAKELAEASEDLPKNFRGRSIGTRAFVTGEQVKIAERYEARFKDLVDTRKPLTVVRQVGNRVVCEQDGSKVLVTYFNLRNA